MIVENVLTAAKPTSQPKSNLEQTAQLNDPNPFISMLENANKNSDQDSDRSLLEKLLSGEADLIELKELIDELELGTEHGTTLPEKLRLFNDLSTDEQLIIVADHLEKSEQFDLTTLTDQNVIPLDHLYLAVNYLNVATDSESALKQAGLLLEDIQRLLTHFGPTDINRVSPRLLKLLNQWNEMSHSTQSEELIRLINDKLSDKESDSLKQLMMAFQKRQNIAVSGAYAHDAEVTTEDVAKWLQHIVVDNQSSQEGKHGNLHVQTTTSQSVPMAHVEQHVIHLNDSSRVERVQDQLIRQFENVMKQSRFLSMPNQLTELSFTLNPNHLGHIHVQMMEVNGELSVKLVVSSLAAKEMLESNIHQLKHMFSPHQVLIERDESDVDDVNKTEDESGDEQAMGDEEQNEHQDTESDERDQFTDFQSILAQSNQELEGIDSIHD